jgi:hypothetical protein
VLIPITACIPTHRFAPFFAPFATAMSILDFVLGGDRAPKDAPVNRFLAQKVSPELEPNIDGEEAMPHACVGRLVVGDQAGEGVESEALSPQLPAAAQPDGPPLERDFPRFAVDLSAPHGHDNVLVRVPVP